MKIKHDAKWFFVEQDPNDRIKSTTRRHALEGDNQSTVARVVREAIQNSVDATLSNRKTEVLFRNQTVSSEAAEEFARLLDLNGNESPLQRLSRLGLKAGNALERLRKLDPNSIEVFIIEDYNTCGLGYDSKDGKDRFDELCLSFGQNRTEVDGERGGSYGFGKEVYEEASDCNLFIVYSVFEPSRKGQEIGSHARLFACATFNGHEWKGGSYKGRALFGVHKKNDRDQIECRPLVDQQAHAVAERLGFEVRARDDYGTSIMILGAKMEMDEVRDALERHWWPRILSNQLSVELWHEDEAQKPPEPCANTDLKPYIDCYEMLQHDIKPKDTLQERKHILQPVNGSQLGSLALKGIEIDPEADDDDEDELRNKIACIRNGPKMVVQYFDPGGRGDGNFTGVFVSHQDAEKALHLSEPPSHDSWNPESRRIQDAYLNKPDKRDQAKKVVESIIKRVKSHAQQFRKDLAPVTLPNPVPGTKKLARILADLMSVKGLGPITPPPPPPVRF